MTPANTAVPTHVVVTIALIYVALDVLPTLLHAALYLVPDREWCVKSSRPSLDALDTAYVITDYLYLVLLAYKFPVYVVAGREFRAALRAMFSDPPPACRQVARLSRCCVEVAGDDNVQDVISLD